MVNKFKQILVIFLFSFFAGSIYAGVTTTGEIATLQLQMEKQRLQEMQNEFNRLADQEKNRWNQLVIHGVSTEDLTAANIDVANAKAMVGNIKIALADAWEAVLLSENEINELRKKSQNVNYTNSSSVIDNVGDLAKQVTNLQNILTIQNQRISNLNQAGAIAISRLEKLQDWHNQVHKLYQDQQERRKQKNIGLLEAKLQDQQQKLLEKLAELNKEFDVAVLPNFKSITNASDYKSEVLQFQIFTTQEQISINRLELFLTQLQERIQPIIMLSPESRSVSLLYDKENQTVKILNELSSMSAIVTDKIKLVHYHKKLLENTHHILSGFLKNNENIHLLDQLISGYQTQLSSIQVVEAQVTKYRSQIQDILKNQYTIRQTLPGLDVNAWMNLLWQVILIPKLLWGSLHNLSVQVLFQFKFLASWRLYLFALMMAFLLSSWFFLRNSFVRMLRLLEDSSRRFSSQVFTVFLTVVRKNLGVLFVITGMLSLHALFDCDMTAWMSMAFVFLGYRLAVVLSRMWLVDSSINSQGKDVRLYHGLKWIYAFAGILTIFTLLAHTLPVAYEVKTLFNKIFMLLMLGVSILLFRAWSVLPELLSRIFAIRRKYVLSVIRLICWVLPLTLFTNAVIGLIGYVDLAWAIGEYQALSLMVLALYMISRGLLMDFMELNYEFLLKRYSSGWLWAQAFVRPIDRILRVVLFFVALGFLLHCYGLDRNPVFIENIAKGFTTPLFNFGGNEVTVQLLVGLLVFACGLYWLAKWSREFAFRWLYSRAKDIGLRNSLSIFTQYIVVAVSVIVGLQVVGVDLKGFAVVAAAFAAGIGFALRDLGANIIGGFVLLIERPFRVGDIIGIDPHEGEVISSGLRSMKIRTFDHLEVIIPNAEIFNKSFVNWTHNDSIVRTVIKVKVNRSDNPYEIQQIIEQVLTKHPAIVKNPEAQVFMKDISDCLLEFEVRYHTNIRVDSCRPKTRSEILLQIWSEFERAGIKHPYPQYEIFLESVKTNFLTSNAKLSDPASA